MIFPPKQFHTKQKFALYLRAFKIFDIKGILDVYFKQQSVFVGKGAFIYNLF